MNPANNAMLDEINALCLEMANDLNHVAEVIGTDQKLAPSRVNVVGTGVTNQERAAERAALELDLFHGDGVDFGLDKVVVGSGRAKQGNIDDLMSAFEDGAATFAGAKSKTMDDLEMDDFESFGFEEKHTKATAAVGNPSNMSDHPQAGILMALEIAAKKKGEELTGRALLGPDIQRHAQSLADTAGQIADIIADDHSNEAIVLRMATNEMALTAAATVCTPNVELYEKIGEVLELIRGVIVLIATASRPKISEKTAIVYITQLKAVVTTGNDLLLQTDRGAATTALIAMVQEIKTFNVLLGVAYELQVATLVGKTAEMVSLSKRTFFPDEEFKGCVLSIIGLLQLVAQEIMKDVDRSL